MVFTKDNKTPLTSLIKWRLFQVFWVFALITSTFLNLLTIALLVKFVWRYFIGLYNISYLVYVNWIFFTVCTLLDHFV